MIKRFILKNYIPLLTKGVSSIELTEFEIINIIIGKNGHGKTRILAELNTLPPDNKSFEGEGYKYVEKLHNGKLYILESQAGSKSVHSFKVEGKELNPNGTQQVQRELVKTYFGVTPLTNKMLAGLRLNDRFSLVPDVQRKDFLMELYPNDTRYALTVHDKLKQALNETVGATRNQTKRLAEERQRETLIASKSVEELEADIAAIDRRISSALFIQGVTVGAKDISELLQSSLAQFNKVVNQVVSFSLTTQTMCKSEILKNIELTSNHIDYYQGLVTKYQTLMGELSNRINGMSKESIDPEIVEKQLAELQEQIDILQHRFEEERHVVEQHPLLDVLQIEETDRLNGFATFARLVNGIVPISDENLTPSKISAAMTKLEELKSTTRGLKQRREHLEHSLQHFEGLASVDCPDCKSNFKPGFDKEKERSFKNELADIQERLKVNEERIVKGDQYVADHISWYTAMTALNNFVTETNDDFFIQLIKDYSVGYKVQDNLINALRSTVASLKQDVKISGLKEQKIILESRLRLIKDNNMDEILNSYEQLDALLSTSSESLGRSKNQFVELNKTLDAYNEYEIKLDLVSTLKERILELLVEEGKFELHRRIKDLIAEFSPIKDSYITTLIRKQSFHGVIASIEQNLADLKDRQAKLKILADGLCPKKGLIGKMMLDFIKTVCGNVNAVVQEIWSTPLYLMPCLNEKGVLDYKFPVINGANGSKADDISYCSGGESEVLNFAMMLVMSKYHRGESPLFLDEIGGMMDEYHRRRFFDYIHRITTSGEVKQLFMVSHYHSEYGMLQNANIIALNTDGLTVPANVNRHAIIR